MKQMLSAVIVDDEEHCRETLIKQLEWSCPNVKVLGQAESVESALVVLKTVTPDLLLLDIEMPGGNGFDLIRKLDIIEFSIIFTTAYDEFALKAFEANAIDYLLKPIDGEALENAIGKVEKTKAIDSSLNLMRLLNQISKNNTPKKIAFPVSDGLEFVLQDDIIRCESEGAYCHVFVKNRPKLFLSKTLKQVSELIDHTKFIRVHNSHLVNADFIAKYIRGKGGQVIMDDGTGIPVSRSRKDDFLDLIQD